jgi:hypothetical protein
VLIVSLLSWRARRDPARSLARPPPAGIGETPDRRCGFTVGGADVARPRAVGTARCMGFVLGVIVGVLLAVFLLIWLVFDLIF